MQIADAPGRGEPGTGEIPLRTYLEQLAEQGYRGYVGLEYKATRPDTFEWLPTSRARRDLATTSRNEDLMSTIAFIGLGIMGSPMACHLVKAGHTVIGLTPSPERTAARGRSGRQGRRIHRAGGQGRRHRGDHGA